MEHWYKTIDEYYKTTNNMNDFKKYWKKYENKLEGYKWRPCDVANLIQKKWRKNNPEKVKAIDILYKKKKGKLFMQKKLFFAKIESKQKNISHWGTNVRKKLS